MFRGYYQCTAVYIAGFLGMFVVLPRGVSAAARFTQEPPSKLYVTKGGTALFVWDYQLDGGTRLDSMLSPQWFFYDSTAHRIGYQHDRFGKTWILDTANCPSRLQRPTVRVSQESNATLVITSVTKADNGVYECRLWIMYYGLPVISKVQLIVTETPTFTVRPNPLLAINEYSDLRISCSAVGPPTPNVTWVQIQGVTKVTVTQGVGSATLSIPDIKIHQNGTYECQAVNNPNQRPVTTQTVVIVYFPPGAPNFTVSDVKASSATIRWTIPVYDGFRQITEYKMEILSGSLHINASDIPHKYISGLRKNKKYGVKLYARNVVGYGSALTKFFTTTGEDRTDASSTPEDAHKCATVIGVCAAFLAVSLLLNVLLALYIWRNVKGPNSQSRKSTSSSYENQVEMDNTSSLSNPPLNHPSPEYESVPPSRVHPQHHPSLMTAEYAIPENAGNRQANQDPRQYQQLNPETKTSQHGTAKPVYEPLSSRPMDVNTGARDDSSERHTYEPLRNRRTESPA